MASKLLYRVPIYRRKKRASEIPPWDTEALLYLPVMLRTVPMLRALLKYAADTYWFIGTDTERQTAVDTILEQASERALTKDEICGEQPPELWGAMFRIVRDEGGASIFQAMQGEGLPVPPWEFRFDIRDGVRWLQFRSIGANVWFDAGQFTEE